MYVMIRDMTHVSHDKRHDSCQSTFERMSVRDMTHVCHDKRHDSCQSTFERMSVPATQSPWSRQCWGRAPRCAALLPLANAHCWLEWRRSWLVLETCHERHDTHVRDIVLYLWDTCKRHGPLAGRYESHVSCTGPLAMRDTLEDHV
jgi:hypothetical protein